MCKHLVEVSWQENSFHGIQSKVKSWSEKLEIWGREITGLGATLKRVKLSFVDFVIKWMINRLQSMKQLKIDYICFLIKRKFSGDNAQSSCGYSRVIKIPDIFMLQQARGGEQIKLQS